MNLEPGLQKQPRFCYYKHMTEKMRDVITALVTASLTLTWGEYDHILTMLRESIDANPKYITHVELTAIYEAAWVNAVKGTDK